MITIRNVTGKCAFRSGTPGKGEQTYEVSTGGGKLFFVRHEFKDGMAALFRAIAKAAEQYEGKGY